MSRRAARVILLLGGVVVACAMWSTDSHEAMPVLPDNMLGELLFIAAVFAAIFAAIGAVGYLVAKAFGGDL